MIEDIPTRFQDKWRRLLNLAAELFDVPVALIMRIGPSQLEVLVGNQSPDNPYREKTTEPVNSGFYCEKVFATGQGLQVPDALADPAWSENPDVRLGLIHYLGVPLIWPDGSKFGTLCILDRQPREHASVSRRLLQHFREQIETDFSLIEFEQNLVDSNDQLELLVAQRTTDLRTEMAERQRLEEALQHVRKMEALAQLAGGVAHDLNNILSGIVSFPDLLLAQMNTDDPQRATLTTIRDSGVRAASVVQDLLSVTRPVPRPTAPVSVNSIVSGFLESPEGLSLTLDNPGVRIELALEPELPTINAASVDLTKVLMNLVINALDAIEALDEQPAKGRLAITTRIERRDEVSRPLLERNHYVVLKVADTGVGMDFEQQQRIFEPYYSSKKLGRSGTGLGLTTVWNVVELHKGKVFVDSSPHGTTFELFFPAAEQPQFVAPTESLPGLANEGELLNSGDGQRVLVVDDEQTQRVLVSAMLETLGFRSTRVSSGKEALDLLDSETFDLIILDMVMPPGMSGIETVQQLRRISPTQKVVMSSGLLEADESRELDRLGVSTILTKPYKLAELARAVSTELALETANEL